jgi:hypothetical protein
MSSCAKSGISRNVANISSPEATFGKVNLGGLVGVSGSLFICLSGVQLREASKY